MSRCLADGGLAAEDVGYINAHATGTLAGDRIETAAIKQVFGALAGRPPVSRIQGAVGHTIGAAGAIEADVAALAAPRGIVPPTLRSGSADTQCHLNHRRKGPPPQPGPRERP